MVSLDPSALLNLLALLQLASWLCSFGLLVMLLLLEIQLGRAPRLKPLPPPEPVGGFLRVVIPAYNEADNIAAAAAAVLASTGLTLPWQLVVVNDGSNDATAQLAQAALAEAPAGSEALLLEAGPRPEGERWSGKNWPASCAAALAWPEGEADQQWLLFLDADVRVQPEAIAAALADAQLHRSDLFSLAPRLVCKIGRAHV